MTHALRSLALLALCGIAANLSAHHSRAPFDLARKVEMKATITQVRWSNPHVFLIGQVRTPEGRMQEWTFEGHSIAGQVRNGWSKDTVKIGDQLTLIVNPHRNPEKFFGLMDNVVLASGQRLYAVGVAPANASATPPKINPSRDFSGNWRYRFPGTPEQVRARVLLGSAGPSADGPYTERARAQVKAWRESDNPTFRCVPISLPAVLMAVYEYRWVRHPDRIEILKEQYQHADRTIWLDGRERPKDHKPDNMGFSTGRFEPDGTLVVTTTGFSPQPWGNGAGIDSSEQKRVVERYRLIDGGMGLALEYTVEDPVYFTQPRKAEGTFMKSVDSTFAPQPPCDLQAATEHLNFD